jgi:hypothetical protein
VTTPTLPAVLVGVEPGSRLDDLLAAYAVVKPQADELADRLKALTDGIKAELAAAAPSETKVDVAHPALPQALRLSYTERWDLDTRRMKAEEPETYVRFARKSGRWELRGVKVTDPAYRLAETE